MIGVLLLMQVATSLPRTCVHTVDEPRPRVTPAEQQLTRRVIAATVQHVGGSRDLERLLLLVAERESSLQPGLVHRLPQDLAASYRAFRHTREMYAGNAWVSDTRRWQTIGLFGMNSNYFTILWDRTADPHVLCDAVVDVLVYRRALVRALHAFARPVMCNGIEMQIAPTWATLHGAVSGGRRCPTPAPDLRHRARRHALNVDRVVTPSDLGREPREGVDRLDTLRAIWADVAAQ